MAYFPSSDRTGGQACLYKASTIHVDDDLQEDGASIPPRFICCHPRNPSRTVMVASTEGPCKTLAPWTSDPIRTHRLPRISHVVARNAQCDRSAHVRTFRSRTGGAARRADFPRDCRRHGEAGVPAIRRLLLRDNTLLCHVLEELGFSVTALSARRSINGPSVYSLPRTHMCLRVDLGRRTFLATAASGDVSHCRARNRGRRGTANPARTPAIRTRGTLEAWHCGGQMQ